MSSPSLPDKKLQPISRYITTHDTSGKAILLNDIPEQAPAQIMPDGSSFSLLYTSNQSPARLNNNEDLLTYNNYITNPPGLTISTGTICRLIDLPPGAVSPMPRTLSLDYGVVLEGEVEMVLDSGQTKVMKRGDVVVQRGTIHAWKNVSPHIIDADGTTVGAWARVLFILCGVEPIEIDGLGKLGEEWRTPS
jgi:hypothetical protein